MVNINLASLFLKNLLKHLSITQGDCLVGCQEVIFKEIARLHEFLKPYIQTNEQYPNGKVSAQIKGLHGAFRNSQHSAKGGITAFMLYKKLNAVCQYIEKKKVLSHAEYLLLGEIFESNFLIENTYNTGLEGKTLQRILTPEVSLHTKEHYFEKIEFIVATVLPKMELKPVLTSRLNHLFATKNDIAEKLFTYNGSLVQFEGMDWVTNNLTHLGKSQDYAGDLSKIIRSLFTVVTVVDIDKNDTGSDNDMEQLVLDEAGFHMSSLSLITSHLAMFNIEIPATSQSEFNRNIYQIISSTVYPAYIDRCRYENREPVADAWKEGFKDDKVAAGLVLHGLHMDQQIHQSFCKRLEEIAESGRRVNQ